MSLLTATALTKSYGAYDVFVGLDFAVAKGDKIALIGPNGCGKTTLLRILSKLDDASKGELHYARGVTFGYLAQTVEDGAETTVWDAMQTSFPELIAIQDRMKRMEEELLTPGSHAITLAKYGSLQHEFELLGGYDLDARIRRVLTGLGFTRQDEQKRISHLSGGQRVRVALARLLLLDPDILLLDEPTNHLDAQGIEWLEHYLQEWEGTLVCVSHDRYFMDEVCERVWEMSLTDAMGGTVRMEQYHGNYTDYVVQRTERRERALTVFEAQQEFIKKEQEFIRRNIAGQNTNQAKGRRTRLNRMERLEKPIENKLMALRLGSATRSGNIVLEATNLTVGYRDDGRTLFSCPDLQLLRTERAALIGANGTGKTSFLKTVLATIPPLAGTVRLGAAVNIGYFAQAHEGLNLDNTVLEELMAADGTITLPMARNILGRFLFAGDDAFKKLGVLSGGERGRVALAKLTLQGANFLLLDEPTNHLDIPSQEILTDALDHFDGTLLLVSHDRYLVAALATQVWSLERETDGRTQLNIFKGTYDAWKESLDEALRKDSARVTPPVAKPAVAKPISMAVDQNATSKNGQIKKQRALEEAEQRITYLERKLSELSWQMELAGSNYERAKELGADYSRVESDLAQAWDALSLL